MRNFIHRARRFFLGTRRKLYPNYELAIARCGTGYNADDLTRVVAAKTEMIERELTSTRKLTTDFGNIRIVPAVAFARPRKVLDFGGACGLHYMVAKHFFGKSFDRWTVVETSAMVTVANRFSDPVLSFAISLPSETPDLVFASGAVQCTPNPEQTLTDLIDVGARSLVLTRTELGAETAVYVHRSLLSENGCGPMPDGFNDRECFYPMWIMSREKVFAAITKRYRIVSVIDEGCGMFGIFATLKS